MNEQQDLESLMRLAQTWWTRAEGTRRSATAQRLYFAALYMAIQSIYEQNKEILQLLGEGKS